MDAGKDEISGGREGHLHFGGEPRQGVTNACGTSVPHPHGIAPVGFEGRADIPPVRAMGGPGGAFAGFDVDQDADAWRG